MSTLSPVQSLLINRCAFPKTVFTPYGPKTVPCGKCLYCRKSHGRTLKSLIHNEMQDATCVQFFTLTYHEFYLPRIILNKTNDEDFPYSVPENACVYRLYPDYEQEPFLSKDGLTQIYYPHVYRQDNKILKNKEYKISSKLIKEYNEQSSNDIEENHIGVLFTPDLQNFFKRLRKTLQTTNNKDIRYFALSEYGGNHFRPHFHIIIFTKSFNANQIKTAVFKSWHFGNIDYSGQPDNANAAASYVSNYVTTTCHTPILLEEISKTRTFHSKFFGLGIIKSNLEFFITHSDYLVTPPPYIYTVNYFISNSFNLIYSEKLAYIPTDHYIRNKQKKLINKLSLSDSSVTSEISATPCNIKVNTYITNYIFPRPFGFSRNNDYLTQILLESYDIFLSHTECKSYENYIIWLLTRLDNHSSTIYEYALGFTKSYYFKDTETPISLKRDCSASLLEMYLIFLKLQKQYPQYNLFTHFSDRHDAIVLINLIYNSLPPEYELTPSEWATELMVVNSIHNRMLSTYYCSKHFCLNIKQSLINTRYYDGHSFNWHLYNIKRKRYETIKQKNQLFNYFSTLEQNTLYPYECFTEDLNNDPNNAKYILPLQNEYLFSQTKHKEINNKLSPIFFDNTEFITY